MQIGEPKYENENRKKIYLDLEKGENVYRVLPAVGNLAALGHWSKYYSVHWGYKDLKGKNRPFLSPEIYNHNTKQVEVVDAAKLKIDLLKGEQEQASKDLKSAVETRNVVEAKRISDRLAELKAILYQYRLEKKYYLNAMTLDGKIGLLKIGHKCKVALDEEIKKLRAKGVSPLGINDGRFFVFSNIGVGSDTAYSVRVYKETIEIAGVGSVEKELVHSLSNEILARIPNEATELDKLYLNNRPSAAQVQAMVNNPSPEIVQTVMDSLKVTVEEHSLDEPVEKDIPELTSPAPTVRTYDVRGTQLSPVNAQTGSGGFVGSPAVTVVHHTAPPAAIAAAKQPVSQPSAAPNYADMSNDEFMKMING